MTQRRIKILVIAYYWPPAGGSGVQRWVKFVKHLYFSGVNPIIYTTKAHYYGVKDAMMGADLPSDIKVIRKGYWDLVQWVQLFKKKKTGGGFASGFLPKPKSIIDRFIYYVRANFFIPDAKRLWIRPSLRLLRKFLIKNPVDAIISTGPPATCHLIAYHLKKQLGTAWVADFRDPWTTCDVFYKLPLNNKSKQRHYDLEHRVLSTADALLMTAPTVQQQYQTKNPNTFFIPNGYDNLITKECSLDEGFSIAHIGMMNEDKNPVFLWETLAALTTENQDFKKNFQLHLVGKIAPSVLQTIQEKGLEEYVKITDYVPHEKANEIQRSSQILLICLNQTPYPNGKGVITGKLFECMASRRPILATVPPDSDLANIINETRSGFVSHPKNRQALKKQILIWHKQYQSQSLYSEAKGIEQYHRKTLTQELIKVLKDII